jgi:hypothetical protein
MKVDLFWTNVFLFAIWVQLLIIGLILGHIADKL